MTAPQTRVKADLRTWAETAMCLHISKSMPLEDMPAFLAGGVLARLMWYWHYDLPPEWPEDVANSDMPSFGLTMVDRTLLDAEVYKFHDHASEVYRALQAGDWQTIRALPDDVWDWVERASGMNREDWEAVPAAARTGLDFWVTCPKCSRSGKLTEVGRLLGDCNPYRWGSTSSPQFECRDCGALLSFESGNGELREVADPAARRRLVVYGALGALLIILYAYVRSLVG